jgi:uncharacterized membrane protein YadS
MTILIYCGLAAVLCVGWFFAHGRLYQWTDKNPTFFRKAVEFASRVLLSASITLIGFTAIIDVITMLMNSLLRS